MIITGFGNYAGLGQLITGPEPVTSGGLTSVVDPVQQRTSGDLVTPQTSLEIAQERQAQLDAEMREQRLTNQEAVRQHEAIRLSQGAVESEIPAVVDPVALPTAAPKPQTMEPTYVQQDPAKYLPVDTATSVPERPRVVDPVSYKEPTNPELARRYVERSGATDAPPATLVRSPTLATTTSFYERPPAAHNAPPSTPKEQPMTGPGNEGAIGWVWTKGGWIFRGEEGARDIYTKDPVLQKTGKISGTPPTDGVVNVAKQPLAVIGNGYVPQKTTVTPKVQKTSFPIVPVAIGAGALLLLSKLL